MASSVNKVILLGNVGRDPEFRTFQNGDRVCSLSIATSETWKDKASGEKKERTEWHRVSVLNQNIIKVIEKYVTKGTKLYIEGKLETRKYTDKDGNEKYTTEITLRPFAGEIQLIDSKKSAPSDDHADDEGDAREPVQKEQPPKPSSAPDYGFDDDIPF